MEWTLYKISQIFVFYTIRGITVPLYCEQTLIQKSLVHSIEKNPRQNKNCIQLYSRTVFDEKKSVVSTQQISGIYAANQWYLRSSVKRFNHFWRLQKKRSQLQCRLALIGPMRNCRKTECGIDLQKNNQTLFASGNGFKPLIWKCSSRHPVVKMPVTTIIPLKGQSAVGLLCCFSQFPIM